jgi:hypothetical protein
VADSKKMNSIVDVIILYNISEIAADNSNYYIVIFMINQVS